MDLIFDNNITIFIVTVIFVILYCFVLNSADPDEDPLSDTVAEPEKHRRGDELIQRIQRRMA